MLQANLKTFFSTASTENNEEWERLFYFGSRDLDYNLQKEIGNMLSENDPDDDSHAQIVVPNISPHITSYFLSTATVLTQSICPADSLPPFPSADNKPSITKKSEDPRRMIDVI